MKNTVLKPVNDNVGLEQEKKMVRAEIKSLQRDLIKASFKQSSAPGAYADLLQAINEQRERLKLLNQQS